MKMPLRSERFFSKMDLKALAIAVNQIAEEKGIKPEEVLHAIESAIAAAYKKEYRKRTEFIRAKFDLKSGDIKFFQVKFVVEPHEVRIVEESEAPTLAEGEVGVPTAERVGNEEEQTLPRYNSDRHIFVEEAKKIKKDAVSGDEIEFPLETQADFGRIAA